MFYLSFHCNINLILLINLGIFLKVVTVGFIEAGQAGNVIPEWVKFGGSYRSITSEGFLYLEERIKEVTSNLTVTSFVRSSLSLACKRYIYIYIRS